MDGESEFERFVDETWEDPDVLALILGGSRARGPVNEWSDWDCLLVVRDEALELQRAQRGGHGVIDVAVVSATELIEYAEPGTPFYHDRYSLARSVVVFDATEGDVTALIEAKATYPSLAARAAADEALDAYLNSVYRSMKNGKGGNEAAAHLDAAESIDHALTAVFAMQGRIRPYNKYLRWEMAEHPLPSVPYGDPERFVASILQVMAIADVGVQRSLMGEIRTIAERNGFGAVYESWDDHFAPLAG